MKKANGKASIAALLIFMLVRSAFGQVATASASGVCRDESGSALPGVTITARNLETGAVRTVLSDDQGRYHIVSLMPGEYLLEATRDGFRTEARRGIRLTVGRDAIVDFVLRVGRIEERIEVVAEASHVETTGAALSEVVDENKIRNLPLNGRDVTQLIQLQVGVNVARTDAGEILTGGKGTRITVAGTRPSGNVFMLDGTIINNLGNRVATGATGQLTGVETIREFRVVTSAASTEFSRVTGGAFNIVTKSGTNEFHGSLFEFHRNDNFDARNFFDAEKPEFKRNQFGFSLGGPIARNRTFFFGSYEGLRESQGLTVIRTVPDLDARRGIVGGERIEIAPEVVPYLNLWPLPTEDPEPGDGSALFTGLFNSRAAEDFYTARIDHAFSDRDSLMGRYTASDSELFFINDENFPQFPNQLRNRPQYLTLRYTRVISPRFTNEAQFSLARTTPGEDIALADPLTELAFINGQAIGTISISGFDVFGTGRNLPRRLTQNSFPIGDQLIWDRGAHLIKAGFQAERFHYNVVSSSRARGEFTFSSLSNFLRARVRTFEGLLPEASDVARSYRQTLFGWFVQDEFKPTRRLSLTLGLRHEFVTVPSENHGRLNNLHDPLDPRVTVGDPFIVSKDNFAPRLGFAWDIFGDGKTALRGGAAIFYDPFLAHHWFNSITRLPPFAVTARASGAAARFPDALEGLQALNLDAVFAVDFAHGRPYVAQYNLNLQREIAPRTVVTVAYVGSRGVKLGREADWNIGSPGNPVRRNPNFTRIRFRTWDANSFYNALQIAINRRFSGGFQAQASYTLAKSIDDASSGLGRSEFNNGQQRTSDPFDHRADRGLSSFDVRQNLVINFTYDLPFGGARRGLLGGLFGGWQLNGIATFASGTPFTPIIIEDLDEDGTDDNEQRPNLRPGASNNPVTGRVEQWFDPSAFESITAGTRGNLGRNTIIGPGLAVFDLALVKNVRLFEGVRAQFRAEFFNLFNRANFAIPPRSNLEIFAEAGPEAEPLPNVGRITSTATAARQMQFALRISF